jgi:uncharacterized SAM-binding protein YcdF (DUF218 family)
MAAGWTLAAGSWLVVSAPLDQPDVIVPLASHEWERLPQAAETAGRFPDALVLLTKPDRVTRYNCHDCEHRPEALVTLGVARQRIAVQIITAPGTFGEALVIRDFMKASGRHRLLVVTSPYHTRRTLGILRHVFAGTGTQFGVLPASRFSEAQPAMWWSAGYDRFYVAYEWAALVYYAARYGVMPPIFARSLQSGSAVPATALSLAPSPRHS